MKVPEIDQNIRGWRQLEMVPGLTTWAIFSLPIILSIWRPLWVAYFIIAYDLFWLTKATGFSSRLVRGYRILRIKKQVSWIARLSDLEDLKVGIERTTNRINSNRLEVGRKNELISYRDRLEGLSDKPGMILDPRLIHHAIIIATYNESMQILAPTVRSLLKTDFPLEKLWVFIAYEERGGEQTKLNAHSLVEQFGHRFGHMEAIEHPSGVEGEVIGKGANITHTGFQVEEFASKAGIDPQHVLVTTLDADNRPHSTYFSYLSFEYAVAENRGQKSYQPFAMFYNNIWDVPAPMRVLATGNSFWLIMESLRPHRVRNFAAHAQPLTALIQTKFWSKKTIVEDGHQYWRSFFTFDGDYSVVPLYTPIFQDAVLSDTYIKTFKQQFYQIRRWAYGASDFPYIVINSWRNKKIAWRKKLYQTSVFFESHISWSTAPLMLTLGAWIPIFLNPEFQDQVLAYQLPVIASQIQTVSMIGLAITVIISLVSLPPRPERYKRRHSVMMVLQWALLPITALTFTSFAAINSQTRLLIGKYLQKFDVTDKAVKP